MKSLVEKFVILLFLWSAVSVNAQTAADSLAPAQVISTPADTLVDLNKQLGGLKEVVVAKQTVLPEAIEVTPSGLIILKSPDLLKADVYNFEVKATASDEEVYIISVKISRKGDKILVNTVSDKIDMATGFRKEGKIYVVIGVSMILFLVIITTLVVMDRRMVALQKKVQNSKPN